MARTVLFAEVPGFYAAIERAEDPALATRPVIVGGDPRKRGRVQAATPDALAAGVCLEMPMIEALQLCPQARAARTDMSRYREVSRRLLTVLRSVHPALEPFGLGGAYADLTGLPEAGTVGPAMHRAVQESLGLPLRVGLASGKFLARLAAESIDGDGVARVPSDGEAGFLAPLPAARLEGVGRKTAATLAELGAHTIGEVAALGRARLEELLGTHGARIHAFASGRDDEPVRAARHPQSLSRESTLRGEPLDVALLADQIGGLAQQLEEELRRQGLAGSRVSLKLRFADQATTTRTRTLPGPTARAADLREVGLALLGRTQAGARPVRALGLQVSLLSPAGGADRQLDLFRPQA